jgi:hypothetical protein
MPDRKRVSNPGDSPSENHPLGCLAEELTPWRTLGKMRQVKNCFLRPCLAHTITSCLLGHSGHRHSFMHPYLLCTYSSQALPLAGVGGGDADAAWGVPSLFRKHKKDRNNGGTLALE